MRHQVARVLLVFVFVTLPTTAWAGPQEVCIGAANEAELLKRDVSKLTRAREKFRTCSAEDCPTEIRDECRQQVADIEKQLPSVVLVAEDGAGSHVLDVVVTLDGAPFATQLDGKPITLDGGAHTFTFTRKDAPAVEVRRVLVAGQKNIEVRVRLEVRAPAPPPPPKPEPTKPDGVPPPPEPSTSSLWPTVGLVTAGVGVLGLGAGAIFGLDASSKQSDAGCPDNQCKDETSATLIRNAQSSADLSTVFFVAGTLLVAGGLTLFFVAPKSSSARFGPRWSF